MDARPSAPDRLIERGLTRDSTPVHVHVGDCWNAGKRSRGASRITDAMDECARLEP
ncbi:DUF6233 domain-containing protein [Streptomyces caelestis]|uniref:DUF6233 domain-containing protein n=1 Tax=Streptomyces caelestis TaxID=36816 RepID=UPI0035E22D78